MANLREWVLNATKDEQIIGVVIGQMGWGNYGLENLPEICQDESNQGKLMDWTTAERLLDYEFSDGYGSPGCQAITVWTDSKVMFVVQYDGSTSLNWVPRNPIPHIPYMPGG